MEERGEPRRRDTERDRFAENFRSLADGLSSLVRGHVELARVELVDDLRGLGKDAVVGVAGVPLALTGYILLWVSISLLLATFVPAWVAFGIAALVNLAVGGVLLRTAANKAKDNAPRLPESSLELRRDRAWLQSLKHEVRH